MVEEGEHESKLLWNDDDSWAFPILPFEENGGKVLIDGGRIVTEGGAEKGKKRSGGGGSGESADDHELHIWTERERRKKMRNMFASLQEMIPNLHPRADKSTIVDEAVAHIRSMQATLENLEKRKEAKLKGGNGNLQSREAFLAEQGPSPVAVAASSSSSPATFSTWSYPNVVVNVCGNDAHINIVSSPRKAGIMSYVVFMMDKYNLDFVSAHVSADATTRIYMIHARANVLPQHFPEAAAFLVEETYKQLASDLMLWMTS